MAQWAGMFTGKTHGTKVADAEVTLRTAVVAFRAATPVNVAAKAKAVRRLAARVLSLRLKRLKSLRDSLTPMDRESPDYLRKLREPEEAAQAAGVAGILAEFAAADVPE